MPTGYTAGIVEGSITSFKEFAILCTRGFGAAMHERDDRLTTEAVKLREPSKYHMDVIEGLQKEKIKMEEISDEELARQNRENILEEIENYQGYIAKTKTVRERLLKIREDAQDWNPPTEDHRRYKEFMLDQLDSTIKADGDSSFWEAELAKAEWKLGEVFDPEKERERRRLSYEKDFSYHMEAYEKEVKSCNTSNEWLQSIYRTL